PSSSSSPKPSATPRTSSTPSSPPASQAKTTGKKPRQKKPAEYQMFRADVPPEALSTKETIQNHIRFIWGCLTSGKAPRSAFPEDVSIFNMRFNGLTVAELRRTGQLGRPIISPTDVGLDVKEAIRSKSKIISAFYKVEESAILHVRTYLARLGLRSWAPDFTQSPYSMYNTTMRMCAIDTFRFLVAGTHYDFLRPNTSFLNDFGLLTGMYDHFVHHYMCEKWKTEIRAPGGNETAAERNNASQARIRLHNSRQTYLKGAAAPKGVRLMFSLKATSDDESTPTGPRALAREERSSEADCVIRAVDKLMVQELQDAGKTRSANNRVRRVAPTFGQRNPSRFHEIPKNMPIQYYDPDWFNDRPPQARAKLAPQLLVAFAPGSSNFFSRRSDNALGVEALTEKYGSEVFAAYD
ncbi:hypothetical protein DFH06DRAFT_942862, partial [Mycena polygramma]